MGEVGTDLKCPCALPITTVKRPLLQAVTWVETGQSEPGKMLCLHPPVGSGTNPEASADVRKKEVCSMVQMCLQKDSLPATLTHFTLIPPLVQGQHTQCWEPDLPSPP